MRINNNMLAINTHRQLGGVALSQAKSMEKLSSGYRINRAGDDAAGLAISEKMRAQIRGLTTAAKNAQDGISLVQTAEGALQEVHGMLNRMVELATQSANGTFDDEVDRKNLESELSALKGEINRVAKSSNFNGIKLLDGSLASSAVKNKIADVVVNGVTGQSAANGLNDVISYVAGEDAKFSALFNVKDATGYANLKFATANAGTEILRTRVYFNDESGERHRIDIKLTNDAAKKVDWTNSEILLDGKKVDLSKMPEIDLSGGDGTKDIVNATGRILNGIKEFKSLFNVTGAKADGSAVAIGGVDAVSLKIEAKNTGTGAEVVSIAFNGHTATDAANSVANNTLTDIKISGLQSPMQEKITVDGAKMFGVTDALLTAAPGANVATPEEVVKQATININGEDFILVKEEDKDKASVKEALAKAGVDKDHIFYLKGANMTADEVEAFVDKINTHFDKKIAEADQTKIVFKGENVPGKKGEGLTLQVGESSEDFQKINVKVNDMSAKGLGISGISVSTQDKAAASISKIREAINTVSSTRGDLGALQNRLEHTISNLNVTAENITASESRIRDVDMAKEMVELTKFNILQQAAQAMLAQANQAPQGVLQLLR